MRWIICFGRKKKAKIEEQLINEINQILADDNIKDIERKALVRVKVRLEKGQYL